MLLETKIFYCQPLLVHQLAFIFWYIFVWADLSLHLKSRQLFYRFYSCIIDGWHEYLSRITYKRDLIDFTPQFIKRMIWIVIIAIFWSGDWLICWIVAATSAFHVESLFCNSWLELEYLLRQFALFVGQIWWQSDRGVWCCCIISSCDIYGGSIGRSESNWCI